MIDELDKLTGQVGNNDNSLLSKSKTPLNINNRSLKDGDKMFIMEVNELKADSDKLKNANEYLIKQIAHMKRLIEHEQQTEKPESTIGKNTV